MNSEDLDILLVEDDPNDIYLALYSLQRERLANRILVVRDAEEALDFLVCRGAFSHRSFDIRPDWSYWI